MVIKKAKRKLTIIINNLFDFILTPENIAFCLFYLIRENIIIYYDLKKGEQILSKSNFDNIHL